mmetsp:Transcript_51445/g.166817  ORF Transcript_51445/g.166817 Transcript_51445/m.166817 type:complete len:223 (-) Transcript_51445:627-1295(-)
MHRPPFWFSLHHDLEVHPLRPRCQCRPHRLWLPPSPPVQWCRRHRHLRHHHRLRSGPGRLHPLPLPMSCDLQGLSACPSSAPSSSACLLVARERAASTSTFRTPWRLGIGSSASRRCPALPEHYAQCGLCAFGFTQKGPRRWQELCRWPASALGLTPLQPAAPSGPRSLPGGYIVVESLSGARVRDRPRLIAIKLSAICVALPGCSIEDCSLSCGSSAHCSI